MRGAALLYRELVDEFQEKEREDEAAAILREFAARVPAQIGTLLRLVEVSVDGGLESTMYEAQAQLADAYLAADRAEEARVIAEDLVTRAPDEISHIERLRTALTMLGVEDVEGAIIARMTALASEPVELFDNFQDVATESDRREDLDEFQSQMISAAQREMDVAPGSHAPAPDVVPPVVEESAEVDLTILLGDLEGQPAQLQGPAAPARPAPDLEDVFAAMRFEAAAGVEADDSAEHLALARSFMEMGQAEQAVEPLQVASRSPQYRFVAAAALGEIFRDQSDLPRAIEWFERAVEAPAPSPEEGRAVLYDLGDVLEAMGETSRALAVFLELAADAPDFRDVGRRVTNLSSAEMEG
jgi:tetratricopeptide (TPR) repeat protein